MLHYYLSELKERAGNPSNAEIAEMSGLQESTVSRMLAGNVDNPRFQSVVDLVIALGGSLDELVGIVKQQPDSVRIDDPVEAVEEVIRAEETALVHPMDDAGRKYCREQIERLTNEMLQHEATIRAEFQQRENDLIAKYERREAALKNEFAAREESIRLDARRRESWLFRLVCLLIAFIMLVLIIDLLNPTFGYFRYTTSMVPGIEGSDGFIRKFCGWLLPHA